MAGEIGISSSVFFRDEFGRFASAVAKRVDDAMMEVAEEGARVAARMAPEIGDTFYPVKLSSHQVAWASSHQWAVGLDRGIPKHRIRARVPGKVLANKEEHFGPVPYSHQPVNHPGVRPKLFFERSYMDVSRRIMSIIRKHTER